jgi:uncharacterized membrane protein
VLIRLLDSLTHVMEYTRDTGQRTHVIRQAEMIMRGAEHDIDEPNDLADIGRRYDDLLALAQRMKSLG